MHSKISYYGMFVIVSSLIVVFSFNCAPTDTGNNLSGSGVINITGAVAKSDADLCPSTTSSDSACVPKDCPLNKAKSIIFRIDPVPPENTYTWPLCVSADGGGYTIENIFMGEYTLNAEVIALSCEDYAKLGKAEPITTEAQQVAVFPEKTAQVNFQFTETCGSENHAPLIGNIVVSGNAILSQDSAMKITESMPGTVHFSTTVQDADNDDVLTYLWSSLFAGKAVGAFNPRDTVETDWTVTKEQYLAADKNGEVIFTASDGQADGFSEVKTSWTLEGEGQIKMNWSFDYAPVVSLSNTDAQMVIDEKGYETILGSASDCGNGQLKYQWVIDDPECAPFFEEISYRELRVTAPTCEEYRINHQDCRVCLEVSDEGGSMGYRCSHVHFTPDPFYPEACPNAVMPDPVIHYTFDENFVPAKMVKDQSGNNYNAVLKTGTVGQKEGIDGQALACNGSGYLEVATNPTAGWNNISVSLWFKTACPTCNYKMASTATWYGNVAYGWVVGTHYPEAWASDGTSLRSGPWTDQTHLFQKDGWNHMIFTYDGATFNNYINGQLSYSILSTSKPLGKGQNLEICAWMPYTAYNYVGLLDDFRVYDTALTEDEVTRLYGMTVKE